MRVILLFLIAISSYAAEGTTKNVIFSQYLLRELGPVFKLYDHDFVCGDKLAQIADVWVDRNVEDEDRIGITLDRFLTELSIWIEWTHGFQIAYVIEDGVVTLTYAGSDELYQKLPKVDP